MTLSRYVGDQVTALIDGVVRESAKVDTSEDGVHDLRVAIRRLSECLRVFASIFPEGAADDVRQDLRVAMKQAGAVRNHDIAGELMQRAESPAGIEMAEGREHAAQKLSSVLQGWNQSAAFLIWRERLRG